MVLTTAPRPGAVTKVEGARLIKTSPPPADQIIAQAEATPGATKLALDALESLRKHTLSPSQALELLDDAAGEQQTAQTIAQAFDGRLTDDLLDRWFSDERTARQVAQLAAAATLDGVNCTDVDRVSEGLRELLVADVETRPQETKIFRVSDCGMPDELFERSRIHASTHFGYHDVEIIAVRRPHSRRRILGYLWRRLDSDFRDPFTAWLGSLADDQSKAVRNAAATTAGLLFTIDPVAVERDVIRAWALDRRFGPHLCAAIALGAPVGAGLDATASRALARSWATSPQMRFRHVAALAYGGILGAWDAKSSAPVHLWQIALETPQLENSALASIASLMSAGASAARIRGTIVELLAAQAEVEHSPSLAYKALPLVMQSLASRSRLARESLQALTTDPDEDKTLGTLATLMTRALLAPAGYEPTQVALCALLDAAADGTVPQASLNILLSRMLDSAREAGHKDALKARLRRALAPIIRGRETDARADAARHVLTEIGLTN